MIPVFAIFGLSAAELVLPALFVPAIAWGAVCRNRDPWAWGIAWGLLTALNLSFGFIPWVLFGLIGLIVINSMPFLCPKCKRSLSRKECKAKTCPRCGEFGEAKSQARAVEATAAHPATQQEIMDGRRKAGHCIMCGKPLSGMYRFWVGPRHERCKEFRP